ncbi:MAG TPA: hypothetical protein VGH19_00235 [Verrucomicrobiae bacterium]
MKIQIAFFTIAFLFAAFIGYRAVQFRAYMQNNSLAKDPGAEAISEAAKLIMSSRQGIAHGNTPEAKSLAEELSQMMKQARQEVFTGGNPDSIDMKLLTKGEFIVFCQLNQDSCIFLIHVPEMKRYETEARKELVNIAYVSAASIMDKAGKRDVRKLGVATRGSILFDSAILGDYEHKSGNPFKGMNKVAEVGVMIPSFNPYFAPTTNQPAKLSPP